MSDAAQGSRVGSQFGRYYLKRMLGRGGMGEVYEAEDTEKERVVALKLLSPALCEDPIFRERLQREARMAGRLQEPHVVPVHDYGEIDGQLYLDMRLIPGRDLSRLLKESGALTPPRAVAIVRQAASALDAAHEAGVIHRDIKPENILITPNDFAYLVDFGIASATTDENSMSAGSAVGTWKYAAPERFIDVELTPSVDVYALACVLYECLTGTPPYRADDAGMLITAHLRDDIPYPSRLRPGVPIAFDAVIARGMAKDPSDRYSSAGQLAHAANDALSARDQDRAEDIVERSEEATLPAGPGDFRPGVEGAAPPGPRADRGAPDPHRLPGGVGPARRAHPAPRAPETGAPQPMPLAPPWGPGHFGDPSLGLSPYQQPRIRRGPSRRALAAAAFAVVVAVGLLMIWLLPSDSTPSNPPASPTSAMSSPTTAPVRTPPPAESQARLFALLPAGYPPGACNVIAPPQGALAAASCGQNIDPDGPPSGSYTLLPDLATLGATLNKIVRTSTVVDCPGRIQSPGAWHRIATPDQVSGTLMCGVYNGYPTVAWTNNVGLMVGIVQATLPLPNLDQIYGWWASHS